MGRFLFVFGGKHMRRQIRGKWIILLVVSLLAAAQLSSCGRNSGSPRSSKQNEEPTQTVKELAEPAEKNPGSYDCNIYHVVGEYRELVCSETVAVDQKGRMIYKSSRYEISVSDELPAGSTETIWFLHDELGRLIYEEIVCRTDKGIVDGYPRMTIFAYDGDSKRETLRRTVCADGYVWENTECQYDQYGNLIFRRELNRYRQPEITAELNGKTVELYRIVESGSNSSEQYPTRALEGEKTYNIIGQIQQHRVYQCDAETGWTPVLTARYKYKYGSDDVCYMVELYDGGMYSLPYAAVGLDRIVFEPQYEWGSIDPFVETPKPATDEEYGEQLYAKALAKNYYRCVGENAYEGVTYAVFLYDDVPPIEYDPEEWSALFEDKLWKFEGRGLYFAEETLTPEEWLERKPLYFSIKFHADGTRAHLYHRDVNYIEEWEFDEHGNITQIRRSTPTEIELGRDEYEYTYY